MTDHRLIGRSRMLPLRGHSRVFAVGRVSDFTTQESPNQTVERMPGSAVTSRLHGIILGALPDIAHLFVRRNMIALGDIIAEELRAPEGRDLKERLLQAMFMMERYRGIDAGWRDAVAEVRDADISTGVIDRLAGTLRVFIRSHREHPDVCSAIWALGALRDDEDAVLFAAVLSPDSGYGSLAREQAQCALEVIRP